MGERRVHAHQLMCAHVCFSLSALGHVHVFGLWSITGARKQVLSDLDTPSQVHRSSFLPSLHLCLPLALEGQSGTFSLLLLQMPWKGSDLLDHAKDERKPLHLKSQESPDQCHDHIKVRHPHWTSWRSLEQQGRGGGSHTGLTL